MKEVRVIYCKGILLKLMLVVALFFSIFTFTIYAITSSLVPQKTSTELFSAHNQVTPKRAISYKYALRKIDLNTPIVCFIPDFISQSEVHSQVYKIKFKEALKHRFDFKPLPYIISIKTVTQTLNDEVFVK